MNQVITHNNIFAPQDRIVLIKSYENSDQLLFDLKIDPIAYDVVLSKNSVIQSGFFTMQDGDVINVLIVPRGGKALKKTLAAVVIIAVSVATAGASSAAMAAFSAGSYGAAIGWGALAVGISIGGGMLLKGLMPKPNMSDIPSMQSPKQSNAYGWGTPTNNIIQGAAVPKIFGTHKITPPLIFAKVENGFTPSQRLVLVYALNDGLIKNVRDIKINGEPIGTNMQWWGPDSFSYSTRDVRWTKGEDTQNRIPFYGIDPTGHHNTINKTLKYDHDYSQREIYFLSKGDKVGKVKINITFPQGIYYANNMGGTDMGFITLNISYTKHRKPNQPIEDIPSNYTPSQTDWITKEFRFENDKVGTIYEAVTLENLEPDQYIIKVLLGQRGRSGGEVEAEVDLESRLPKTVIVDSMIEYTPEDIPTGFSGVYQAYPGTALLALKIEATANLSGGMPTVSCIVEQGESNPANVARQILLDCGVPSQKLSGFDKWAKFCEQNQLTCNIVFDSNISVHKALELVGTLGRASVVQVGSGFDVIIDGLTDDLVPVQSFMFGMGNILRDSFKLSFLPMSDRSNIIELIYYDEKKDYAPTSIMIGQELGSKIAQRKSQIDLIGCTDRAQAKRYANFLLNYNKYLTQTVEFEASIDSLVCRYGDLIKVSHEVPSWGLSGRILADYADDGLVYLDSDLSAYAKNKNYSLQVKDELNRIFYFEVRPSVNKANALDIIGSQNTQSIKANNIYSFGEVNKQSKLFRIVKIATDSELTRLISAIEFVPEIYQEGEFNYEEENDIYRIVKPNLEFSAIVVVKKDENQDANLYLQIKIPAVSLGYTISINQEAPTTIYTNTYETKVLNNNTYNINISSPNATFTTQTINVNVKAPEKPPRIVKVSDDLLNYYIEVSHDNMYDEFFKGFVAISAGKTILSQTSNKLIIAKTTSKQSIKIAMLTSLNTLTRSTEVIVLKAIDIPNVSGLLLSQNQEQDTLVWDECSFVPNIQLDYFIRRGDNWNEAQVLGQSRDTSFAITAPGRYLIKAGFIAKAGLF